MSLFKENIIYDGDIYKGRGIIIRQTTVKVLDEKDLEFIEGLQNLGVNQNVAKLITYLKDVDEGSSRDIEMATGMRQPEVSVAMGTLRTMKWISEHVTKGTERAGQQGSTLCVLPSRRSYSTMKKRKTARPPRPCRPFRG